MVRLKVNFPCSNRRVSAISIPYGSIKSNLITFKQKGGITISIPYGSIKRTSLIWQKE